MKILEIEINTDNLLETEHFYSNVLGLSLVNKEQNTISYLAGQSKLTFLKSTDQKPTYHFAFNIPHNKLDEAINWATVRLSLIENTDNGLVANFDSWNAKAIYFQDNNNNILEFIARFDLSNSTTNPFDISSIQSISEIGIVTDSPLNLAEKMVKENNLSYYSKSTYSEQFAALGNDNGLFVIVENNRNWYPTKQKAEKHYTKIKIETHGLIRELIINDENVNPTLA